MVTKVCPPATATGVGAPVHAPCPSTAGVAPHASPQQYASPAAVSAQLCHSPPAKLNASKRRPCSSPAISALTATEKSNRSTVVGTFHSHLRDSERFIPLSGALYWKYGWPVPVKAPVPVGFATVTVPVPVVTVGSP